MNPNKILHYVLIIVLWLLILNMSGCDNGDSIDSSKIKSLSFNEIKQIEDIEKLDEIISMDRAEYSQIDYENYEVEVQYFGFEENLDDKLNFRLTYTSDNCEVVGYICVPADYLEKDYPVLIYNRGGNNELEKVYPALVAQYSNFGFIMLATQYRGNDGGTGDEDFGGDDVQDVLSLIDITQELPFTNGKIYMLGGSRGGLQTYCTLKADSLAGNDRIAAAVVMSGVSDLESLYYYRDWDMKVGLKTLIGGAPDQLPAEYEKRSAVFWPELIHTPLLIIHGKTDTTVPVDQAEVIYDKLKELDKDVELRIYDAGHQDLSPESFVEAMEWLHGH